MVALSWLQDGVRLASDRWVTETSQEYVTSRLTIRGARLKDSGTYACAPANAAHAHVQVHVISGRYRRQARGVSVACVLVMV